ncbi:RNA polymerase II transcription factor B 52 kDa subunit [Coemansia sp. RSA 1694]|nr:RNA polymerase II transcription factor B 52 kDa subunit [Coemansia sp. RSA 25]KAJ2642350.1 RNA polymerase II transcription factor B 52 kDa subunit [Coemansia sp. RSA 1694]
MSMLYLDTAIKIQDIHQWAKADHRQLVKSKVHQLRKLQILTEERGGDVSLSPIFREQLRNALTGGGDFSSFGIPSTLAGGGAGGGGTDRGMISKKWLASYANDRWEAILHFMVGQSADAEPPSESVRGILRMSKLMEDSGEDGMKITNSGFQFLLQDSSSQVWTVLLQYLRLAEMQDMDVVEVLNFTFQLISLQLGRPYSTEALTRNQRKMLTELCDFGLLYQESASQFYPTHFITSLSSGSASHSGLPSKGSDGSGPAATAAVSGRSAIPTTASGGGTTGELAKPSDQGFIILETNCRMYAYTESPLQIAILNLFVHLVNRFPNFITGALTRDSVRRALARGITADQIITFLTTHAHPQMQGRTPVLPITVTDQIRLWEQERNRLKPSAAYFYKDFGQKQEYERMFKYAQDIGVVLWASNEKRQLVVTRQGHAKIAELVKSQRAANAANAAAAAASASASAAASNTAKA